MLVVIWGRAGGPKSVVFETSDLTAKVGGKWVDRHGFLGQLFESCPSVRTVQKRGRLRTPK